jgi:5-methylcytosine-specific restriction endonuclease McrA
MSKVFVVDSYYKPLDPVHPGWARLLLKQGKASVYRRFPFTIILKIVVDQPQVEPLRLKIDPGSKTTGIAVVNDVSGEVVFAANLQHRGKEIKKHLDDRRAVRHNRRARLTRYRKPRFQNRRRKKGWLPPSLSSRIANILTWVNRMMRYCPIIAISQELVKFDLQKMENPEISGIQYQQGTLQGYECREYLLEKWNRQCAYCRKKDVPLQIEHIQPRAHGGTDRISNLCLACEKCNIAKGTQDINVFLKSKPEVLGRILAHSSAPLKDAAAVNATRWLLYEKLKATGLPVECGSGGLTKFNRTTRDLPKDHWCDACCIGKTTPRVLEIKRLKPLLITAFGHGCRQMCLMNDAGFPRTKPKAKHFPHEFRTGDIVRAVVPVRLKNRGVHVGRMSAKAKGGFTIYTSRGKVTDIGKHYCSVLQRADGYAYSYAKQTDVYGQASPAPAPNGERLFPPHG